jgi:hypothetical protein
VAHPPTAINPTVAAINKLFLIADIANSCPAGAAAFSWR